MSEYRKEHLEELVKNLCGEYLTRESNLTSLVTVTRAEISDDMKTAIVFISVFPDEKQTEALHFVLRHRTELRQYVMKRVRAGRLPFIDIKIDKGEKLRNRMDEVL
jgi:ribosome-binding factor A